MQRWKDRIESEVTDFLSHEAQSTPHVVAAATQSETAGLHLEITNASADALRRLILFLSSNQRVGTVLSEESVSKPTTTVFKIYPATSTRATIAWRFGLTFVVAIVTALLYLRRA